MQIKFVLNKLRMKGYYKVERLVWFWFALLFGFVVVCFFFFQWAFKKLIYKIEWNDVAGNFIYWLLRYFLLDRVRKVHSTTEAEWDSWYQQDLVVLTMMFVRVAALGCADRSLGLDTMQEPGEANQSRVWGWWERRHRRQGSRDSRDVPQEHVSQRLVYPFFYSSL